MKGWPPWALDDEMLTMRPQPAAIMSGTTAWQQWNVPVRLTSRMRFQVSALDLEERAEAVETGVVDEHGGGTQTRPHLGDRGVEAGTVGDVHGQADGGAARGRDLGRGIVGGLAVEVEHGDRQAVGGQPLGDGEADARAAAGDDGGALGAGGGAGAGRVWGGHWIGSSPANVVRCMSRGEVGS